MKIGTHNLGSNAFAQMTIVKIEDGSLIIRQIGSGAEQKISFSANQIALLKDVLA